MQLFHEFSKLAKDYDAVSSSNYWKQFEQNYALGRYRNCGINVLSKMAGEDDKEGYQKLHINHKTTLLKKIVEEMMDIKLSRKRNDL